MLVFFGRHKKQRPAFSATEANIPTVAILVAAYNEEKVIAEKITSIFKTTFPLDKLKLLIGSDASTDNTDKIIAELSLVYPQLHLVKFTGRVGKISIVNQLQSLCEEEILIMSDANVMFTPDTIFELIKYFKEESVGIVAGNITKQSATNEGISYQEKMYLSLENKIKAAESNAFDMIMGAEGGCYAIRNSLFSKVPSKFNVDDFYITFQVLLKNRKALFNPNSLCVEDVPGAMQDEYRRKVRISSGNFQNLFFFKAILYRFWKPFGFAFLSHKVLRWYTPFFILLAFLSSGWLQIHSTFYASVFFVQVGIMLLAFVNFYAKTDWRLLKFITHFYFMNVALIHGFFRFTMGIKTSIWEPVDRHVS
jgi:cellulose synthase/poly-beta-1,6-N-acetylglucosamine synthase-like glycosyltransferase